MPKIEKILSPEKLYKLGFGKKWCSDKKGYWYTLIVDHPVLGKCDLILDDHITIEVLVHWKTKARARESIAYLKCTEKSVRELFKMFGIKRVPFCKIKNTKLKITIH